MEGDETTVEQEGSGKSSVVVELPLLRSSTPIGPVHKTPKVTPKGTPVLSLLVTSPGAIRTPARAPLRLLEPSTRLRRL